MNIEQLLQQKVNSNKDSVISHCETLSKLLLTSEITDGFTSDIMTCHYGIIDCTTEAANDEYIKTILKSVKAACEILHDGYKTNSVTVVAVTNKLKELLEVDMDSLAFHILEGYLGDWIIPITELVKWRVKLSGDAKSDIARYMAFIMYNVELTKPKKEHKLIWGVEE